MSKQRVSVFETFSLDGIWYIQDDFGVYIQNGLLIGFWLKECKKNSGSRIGTVNRILVWVGGGECICTCFSRNWHHWDLAVGVSFSLALSFSWFFLHSSVRFITIWKPALQGMKRHHLLPREGWRQIWQNFGAWARVQKHRSPVDCGKPESFSFDISHTPNLRGEAP